MDTYMHTTDRQTDTKIDRTIQTHAPRSTPNLKWICISVFELLCAIGKRTYRMYDWTYGRGTKIVTVQGCKV